MIETPLGSEAKIQFSIFFSRFEFALKETGFLRPGSEGRKAFADWTGFAKEHVLDDIFVDIGDDGDIQSFIHDPPATQIVVEGCLVWKTAAVSPMKDIESLLLAVKNVRNNLFHGGKSGENVRDDMLCRAGTKVLQSCLGRHARVRAAFIGQF